MPSTSFLKECASQGLLPHENRIAGPTGEAFLVFIPSQILRLLLAAAVVPNPYMPMKLACSEPHKNAETEMYPDGC